MQNNKLKADPVTAAFVFDNENDCLRLVKVASSLKGNLAETVPTCMRHAVLIDGRHDMRIMAYEFPNLHSVPYQMKKLPTIQPRFADAGNKRIRDQTESGAPCPGNRLFHLARHPVGTE